MASKKKEPGFDADKFLDSYEETAARATSPATGRTPPRSAPPDSPKAEAAPQPDRELEYMEHFILRNKYRRISRKGRQVYVCDEFKMKMQKLMLFFSDGGSITEYVNNVLEQHFKEYDDIIKRMFNNSIKI